MIFPPDLHVSRPSRKRSASIATSKDQGKPTASQRTSTNMPPPALAVSYWHCQARSATVRARWHRRRDHSQSLDTVPNRPSQHASAARQTRSTLHPIPRSPHARSSWNSSQPSSQPHKTQEIQRRTQPEPTLGSGSDPGRRADAKRPHLPRDRASVDPLSSLSSLLLSCNKQCGRVVVLWCCGLLIAGCCVGGGGRKGGKKCSKPVFVEKPLVIN